jgi:hypothetical protein
LAGGWCWFVLREEYCWLVAGGWFVLREKYCWLVADKPSEQGVSAIRFIHQGINMPKIHVNKYGCIKRNVPNCLA